MRRMNAPTDLPLRFGDDPATTRSLRIAVVTETYPPEVNGVSLTVARMVEGLHARNHELQLVRPRQTPDDEAGSAPRFHEVLMRGLPIPRYPHLKMGLPAKKALLQLWSMERPDVVHVATEGPLGYLGAACGAPVEAAGHVRLPDQLPCVQPALRRGLDAGADHGLPAALPQRDAYATMVPTEPLRA